MSRQAQPRPLLPLLPLLLVLLVLALPLPSLSRSDEQEESLLHVLPARADVLCVRAAAPPAGTARATLDGRNGGPLRVLQVRKRAPLWSGSERSGAAGCAHVRVKSYPPSPSVWLARGC